MTRRHEGISIEEAMAAEQIRAGQASISMSDASPDAARHQVFDGVHSLAGAQAAQQQHIRPEDLADWLDTQAGMPPPALSSLEDAPEPGEIDQALQQARQMQQAAQAAWAALEQEAREYVDQIEAEVNAELGEGLVYTEKEAKRWLSGRRYHTSLDVMPELPWFHDVLEDYPAEQRADLAYHIGTMHAELCNRGITRIPVDYRSMVIMLQQLQELEANHKANKQTRERMPQERVPREEA